MAAAAGEKPAELPHEGVETEAFHEEEPRMGALPAASAFVGTEESDALISVVTSSFGKAPAAVEPKDPGDDDSDEEEEKHVGPYTLEELPPEHCSYCGIFEPSALVKCTRSGKWFCNTKHGVGGAGGSCVINHLVKGRSREVVPHPKGLCKDIPFRCAACGVRNLFVLGLLPARVSKTLAVVCRVCVTSRGASLRSLEWDPGRWQALVQERAILPVLVRSGSEEAMNRAWAPTSRQMLALEELWRTHPTATLMDLLSGATSGEGTGEGIVEVMEALIKYEDAYHYQNVLAPLVQLEAEEDRRLKESRTREDIDVSWDVAPHSGQDVAKFMFVVGEEAGHLLPGDELTLSLASGRSARRHSEPWEDTGVVRSAEGGLIALELSGSDLPPPTDVSTGFSARFVWRPTTFERMQASLKVFALNEKATSEFIRRTILGSSVSSPPSDTVMTIQRVTGLPDLNEPQATAVQTAISQPVTLIQGPPGTGKTVTSAAIVWHLLKMRQTERIAAAVNGGAGRGRWPRTKILVAAPSNIAVDNLAAVIARTGVRVVRLMARSREQAGTVVEELALHKLALTMDAPHRGTNIDLLASFSARVASDPASLSNKEMRQYRRLQAAAEAAVLEQAEVVCATCVGAGDSRLSRIRFSDVLVDEATQATEPEVLIPILTGCTRLILVGDHCQLGPVVQSKIASNAGLVRSLFERLIYSGMRPVRLRVQYRMHPALSQFPSDTFYDGSLQNGVTVTHRLGAADAAIKWPVPGLPHVFFSCTSTEELASSGISFLNRGEAKMVDRVVARFLKAGVSPADLCVITPYEGQRILIDRMMSQEGTLPSERYKGLEIASVDSFQGREKDYVVVSCVRSNTGQGIGFLADPRRLNVTLTRARLGIVIVGNPQVLARDVLWNCLLHHYQNRECLIDGSFDAPHPVSIRLPDPQRWVNPRYRMLLETISATDARSSSSAGPAFPTLASVAQVSSQVAIEKLPLSARNMVLAAAIHSQAGTRAHRHSQEEGVTERGVAASGTMESAQALIAEQGEDTSSVDAERAQNDMVAAVMAPHGLATYGAPGLFAGSRQIGELGELESDPHRAAVNQAAAALASGGASVGGYGYAASVDYSRYDGKSLPDSARDDDLGSAFGYDGGFSFPRGYSVATPSIDGRSVALDDRQSVSGSIAGSEFYHGLGLDEAKRLVGAAPLPSAAPRKTKTKSKRKHGATGSVRTTPSEMSSLVDAGSVADYDSVAGGESLMGDSLVAGSLAMSQVTTLEASEAERRALHAHVNAQGQSSRGRRIRRGGGKRAPA
jgi:regulator of nonsense transcripts 1